MADAVELATAYVSLVPSMRGAEGAITKELVPGAESAAESAGKAAGGRFSGVMGKALIGGAALGAGVVAGFKGLYEVGGIFDDVADTIRVGTGKSGEALDSLTQSAENIGRSVPASFESVGQTVADVNQRMGLSGGTLEKVASQYLEAGRILGQQVDVQKTSAAFSAFKIEGEAVSGAMDSLFQVSQATGVGMNELADSVSKNAPAMQTLGFSFEETAALAGSLDKAGLNSTAMMAAMSKGMVTLAKDGEEPEAAFKRVTGEIQGFIKDGDKAAAIDLAGKVFGTRGAAQFVGALESGKVKLDDLVNSAGLSGDTILDVGAETQDFAEKWQLVQNNAAAALEPLGSAVFTWLGDTVSGLLPVMEGLAGWFSQNTWAFGVLAGVVGGVLVVAFIAWAASVWAATAALFANPVTWIVLGIVALIAALVLLIANWDSVAAFLAGVWSNVVNFAVGIWNNLASFFSGWISGVVAWFNNGIAGLRSWLAGTWSNISNFARGVWNGLLGFFGGLIGNIVGRFNAGISNLRGWLAGTWNNIVGFARGVWSGFLGFVGGIVGNIVGRFNAGISNLRGWLAGAWNGIAGTARGIWNGLVGFVVSIPGRFLGGLAAIGGLAGRMGAWVNGARNAAVGAFNGLIGWVAGVPGRILGALGGLGGLLVGAGQSIINGFLNGLRGAFEGVKNFVGGIADWIAKNKGPKAYDLALLVPAGGWIMQGLEKGIRGGIPDLKRTLGGVSDVVAGSIQGGTADLRGRSGSYGLGAYDVAAAAAGSGPVYVQNPFTGEYLLARVDSRVGAGISGANADIGRRRVGVR
ncbi:tape measure protein [Arthrobacter phage Renna12]|nr:tape measure protein [Arthrobacter phage Renna12]